MTHPPISTGRKLAAAAIIALTTVALIIGFSVANGGGDETSEAEKYLPVARFACEKFIADELGEGVAFGDDAETIMGPDWYYTVTGTITTPHGPKTYVCKTVYNPIREWQLIDLQGVT